VFPGRAGAATVLVVDDDAGVRESYQLILGEDHHVIAVSNGPAALEMARSHQIDVVLLDLLLPGLDGLEVLRDLKATNPQVPVVMVTGVRTVVTGVEAMRLGAFDYLTKPFDEDEVLDVVARALAQRNRRRRRDRSEVSRERPALMVAGGTLGWRAAISLMFDDVGVVAVDSVAAVPVASVRASVECLILDLDGSDGDGVKALWAIQEVWKDRPLLAVADHGSSEIGLALDSLPTQLVSRTPGYFGEVIGRASALLGLSEEGTRALSHYSSRAIECIASDLSQRLTVRAMADRIGVSPSHLAHVFRADTGWPLKRFLIRVRARAAEHLL
jgi:DNA-binding response OmpR family regulator